MRDRRSRRVGSFGEVGEIRRVADAENEARYQKRGSGYHHRRSDHPDLKAVPVDQKAYTHEQGSDDDERSAVLKIAQ